MGPARPAALAALLLAAVAAAAVRPPAPRLPGVAAQATAGRVRVLLLERCAAAQACERDVLLQWLDARAARVVHSLRIPELAGSRRVTRLEAEWSAATAPRFRLALLATDGTTSVVVLEVGDLGRYRLQRR